MAYVSYTGLTSPNQVLTKIADYVTTQGYTIVHPISDDLNIYDMSYSDGKKFAFKDATGDYVVILRSADGTNIFGVNSESAMDTASIDADSHIQGIGMVVAESYSKTTRWYNQYKAPKGKGNSNIYGVFMPVPKTLDDGSSCSFTLYCNRVKTPTDTLVFSLVKENDTYMQTAHLIVGNLNKYDEWTGGIFFSGSANRDMVKNSYKCFEHKKDADAYILPLLGSSSKSNTFLRVNIDDAPTDARGNIYWACGGSDNVTGKKLSTPIRINDSGTILGNGKIPHYGYLQSSSRLDWGRNINTLNCITVDMPIFMAVCVDPDVLENYASVGIVSGVSYISTLNVQTSYTYPKSYPESKELDQVFPFGKRRGNYGFDGFGISQQ